MGTDELEMVQDAARIAGAVREQVDESKVNAGRNLDDEFASRIATASYTGSVASFLEKLRTKMGVRSVDKEDVLDIVKKYDGSGDARTFLKTVRNNSALVVLEMENLQ